MAVKAAERHKILKRERKKEKNGCFFGKMQVFLDTF
jgi:hypothetical protein